MKTLQKVLITLSIVAIVLGGNTAALAATTHTVQAGDTMWKIAVKYQVGVSEVIQANPAVKNPNLIYPGQKLNIPELGEVKSAEEQVAALVNQERSKYGLQPLKLNWELSRVARYKSQDMIDKYYFSHTSPTYGSPFTMMKNFGISYRAAGENIAAGQKTPQEVMNAWMNSEGHRKNILSSQYTEIGVGYAKGGSYGHYWTQMFISK
ncbi:SafA/ExsA family spore coat assembly protein [Bacillus tianshenii]|uniref:SafA/ExsA family spore coat assembly protein n=1 Tax=Sutcliffiella tianshenii TaxID=1463404 RepID=UPI001CD511ED|nr:SafA/ExsA family spore coat assembly protein [Bacillus tianshenii]MCA1319096.1 SafA/ExsA family spore coat assembly protein [Bacillus tianshenii]